MNERPRRFRRNREMDHLTIRRRPRFRIGDIVYYRLYPYSRVRIVDIDFDKKGSRDVKYLVPVYEVESLVVRGLTEWFEEFYLDTVPPNRMR